MTKEEQEAFVKARISMADILSKEEMYQPYVDNITMALWGGYVNREFTTSRVGCNKAAKRIMAVIFDIEEK